MSATWAICSEEILGDQGRRYVVEIGGRQATFADVVQAWQYDEDFRTQFIATLAESPYEAFRWETPGVSEATLPFEFVLIDAPGLAPRPDPNAFAEHFDVAQPVVTFANLSGDAILVVPYPITDPAAYGHLASFLRSAPESQRHALWQAVGNAMQVRMTRGRVWLSTAGAGVSWLHVRLDDRPKYYSHAPYRQGTMRRP